MWLSSAVQSVVRNPQSAIFSPMSILEELETPAPIVDLDRLERNLDRMAQYAGKYGLSLRPHIKTHKSPMLATEQLRRGAIGLTCATAAEVEVMSAANRVHREVIAPLARGSRVGDCAHPWRRTRSDRGYMDKALGQNRGAWSQESAANCWSGRRSWRVSVSLVRDVRQATVMRPWRSRSLQQVSRAALHRRRRGQDTEA